MLTPQGPASYYCGQPSKLATQLELGGYAPIPIKSEHETARYHRGASFVILYRNGTVLLQGSDLETPRRLFARLVEAEQQHLPF